MSSSIDQTDSNEDDSKWFDLNPDRKLLDSNFEGYKLSLDSFPRYKLDLTKDYELETYNPTNDEKNNQKVFLFQHLKLIGLQNLIIVNQFDDSNVYYFDSKFRLIKIVYKTGKREIVPTNLQLKNLSDSNSNRVNITMKFINKNTCVVFDGYETIYAFENIQDNDSTRQEKWNELFQFSTKNLEKFGIACILKDAILLNNETLHLLFMNVQESSTEDNPKGYVFETLINWLMFEFDSLTKIWNLKRVRRLNCFNSVPDYVALETNCLSVYIAGPNNIRYEFDSVKGVQLPNKTMTNSKEGHDSKADLELVEKFYTWNQKVDEVTMNVCILESSTLSKNELTVILKSETLEILYRDKTIINDRFFSRIKVDESTWILNPSNHEIELTLTKENNEIWPVCLKDMHKFGDYKQDTNEPIETPKDMENKQMTWEETQNLYRLEQQLEECDAMDDEPMRDSENGDKMLMFRRLDGDSHTATHKTYIHDNKFLFDVKISPSKSPAFCLRHDVDGILWQPHRINDTPSSETIWMNHVHTFQAFGYVQASKTNTKFRSCPPNCSYACIADANSHLYIYKSVASDTQLKNRKSGKMVTNIAKQYLISLESDDEIYGLYCSNDFIIVLLSHTCYLYKINSD